MMNLSAIAAPPAPSLAGVFIILVFLIFMSIIIPKTRPQSQVRGDDKGLFPANEMAAHQKMHGPLLSR